MKNNLVAASILSFALAGVANAQATAPSVENGTHYTQAQLKELARNAHAPAQYSALAAIYGNQQKDYLQKAEEERQEWVGEVRSPYQLLPSIQDLWTRRDIFTNTIRPWPQSPASWRLSTVNCRPGNCNVSRLHCGHAETSFCTREMDENPVHRTLIRFTFYPYVSLMPSSRIGR